MSKETERAIIEFKKLLQDRVAEGFDEEEPEEYVRQYSAHQETFSGFADAAPTADDYLDLAEEAGTKKKKLEYLSKALELEPDNLDASLMMAETKAKTALELLEAIAALKEQGERQMKAGRFLPDDVGDFWLVVETRPYMRVRLSYFAQLIECGMMRAAAEEGEELLRLCRNDNPGARFQLMHLYAHLENETAAKKLLKKYSEYDESMMLLPMAALYFKLNKLKIAEDYLNRLLQINKDTKKLFSSVVHGKLSTYAEALSPYGYRPYTMDELIVALMENTFLYTRIPEFFVWGNAVIRQSTAKPKK